MIIAVLVILVLVAVAASFTAVISAITVVQLAPRGQKLSVLFRVGWLRPLQRLARYRMATFGVIAAAAMSFLLAAERSN